MLKNSFKPLFFLLATCSLLLVTCRIEAKPKLFPSYDAQGQAIRTDLQAPFNVQRIEKDKQVTLAWSWQTSQPPPLFTHFGYEILRNDEVIATVADRGYVDAHLGAGNYNYKIRARGITHDEKRTVLHESLWSEPAEASVALTCDEPPQVTLQAEATRRPNNQDIRWLKLLMKGTVQMKTGCTLKKLIYTVDAGTGIAYTGILQLKDKTSFEQTVKAFQGNDEILGNPVILTITVMAENEAGPTTSDATTLTFELQNPYAPSK